MARPNFFLVGASKSGTTSLAHALGDHPEIFMSQPKEPNFFNRIDHFERIDSASLRSYLSIFDQVQNEKVIGEASVAYLSSEKAPRNICSFSPNAKILISLRNPLERIVSMYEMYVRHGLAEPFHQVTKEESWLVKQNLYSPNIELFLECFPRENLKVIEFSSIRDDWDATMLAIFSFLSVQRIKVRRVTMRNTGGVPSSPVFNILRNRTVVKLGKIITPDRWHERIDFNIKRLAFKKLHIPDSLLEELRNRFSEDASKLDSLLGSDFNDRWFGTKH